MSVFKHQITASMAKDIAFSLGVEPSDEEAEAFADGYNVAMRSSDDYQHLKNVQELYHAQEKRLFTIAKRIKGPAFDKYAHSPSQAIDVLESAIFGENEESGRAAMFQGKYRDLSQPVDPQISEYEKIMLQAGNSPTVRGETMKNGISEIIEILELLDRHELVSEPPGEKTLQKVTEDLREIQKQTDKREATLLALVDTYDWQRQRLHQAAEKVIGWLRQEAKDHYGDANKAESDACVRELRDAIRFCKQKESGND